MTENIFGAFSALIIVLGLLGLFAWLVRRFGFMPGQPKFGKAAKDLEILESKMIDARNRLVVARWRGDDYLLAFGADGIAKIDTKKTSKSSGHAEDTFNEPK